MYLNILQTLDYRQELEIQPFRNFFCFGYNVNKLFSYSQF